MKLTDGRIKELVKPHTFVSDLETYLFDMPDLQEFARAVIAAEDAERLKDVVPATLHQIDDAYDAWELCGDDSIEEPKFYSADTVSALKGRIAELEKLSVTKIMLDVVSGEHGEGVEVFAKSVEDVEELLSEMGQKLEDYVLQEQGLVAKSKDTSLTIEQRDAQQQRIAELEEQLNEQKNCVKFLRSIEY